MLTLSKHVYLTAIKDYNPEKKHYIFHPETQMVHHPHYTLANKSQYLDNNSHPVKYLMDILLEAHRAKEETYIYVDELNYLHIAL